MTKRLLIGLALTICASLFFSGFYPSLVAGKEKTKIRIGLDVSTNSLPFWVADSEGIYEKYGLDATSKIYEIGFMGLLAVGAGEGDTSIQSEPPTVVNIAKGIDAYIIASTARTPEVYKVISTKEIKNPKDLIGKKVGVKIGSGGNYFMHRFLTLNDIKQKDLKKVYDAAPQELCAMLYKGELDAIFVWQPFGRKFMTMEKAGEKFHILGGGAKYFNAHMFLTVRKKFADEHPEAVKNLLRALIEAKSYIDNNREKCVKITRYILRTSYDEAAAAIDDYLITTPTLESDILPALDDISKWLKENKKIKTIPDWKKIIQPKFLEEVDPSKVELKLD